MPMDPYRHLIRVRKKALRFAGRALVCSALALNMSCGSGGAGDSSTQTGENGAGSQSAANQLQSLEDLGQIATVTVDGHALHTWLALTDEQRQKGLMRVTEAEMAPTEDGRERAMLFVFPSERPLSFWMLNTIIPLDIAFARSDGRIVKIHTMPPLTTQPFPSIQPAQFALEVAAGTFQRLGIAEGDSLQIPQDILKAR